MRFGYQILYSCIDLKDNFHASLNKHLPVASGACDVGFTCDVGFACDVVKFHIATCFDIVMF